MLGWWLSRCVPNAGAARRPVAAGWQNLAAGRCAAQQLHARVHGNGRGRNRADAVVRLPTFGTAPPRNPARPAARSGFDDTGI